MSDCPKCGHRNLPDGDRCESCGASLRPPAEPPTLSEEFEKELLALMQQGQKIQAIKRYRDQTKAGLKDAKDAVEALAARHGIKGTGCAGVVVLMAAAVGSLACFLLS